MKLTFAIQDIVAGLLLVAILFVFVIPLVDKLDPYLLKHGFGGLFILAAGIFLAICTPGADRWTPARLFSFKIIWKGFHACYIDSCLSHSIITEGTQW